MAKKAGIRYDIKIMHPKVNGGGVETFEESIDCMISELIPETFYVRTNIGVLPRMTYDFIVFTKNSVVLEAVLCVNCKEYVIMSTQAVKNEDITICPCCMKNIYKKGKK
ncbi:MAG: hypothetical protein ACRDB0_05135 [Paraclostridium sp.]